ncbi:Mov34/MPN/PAD-1 family protein [Alicyclobacillus cycloheptanicus]|uniref:Proteasome lid subunit RPN8/RPN11 n=1 Tax=Alicyclobacillus cycloheptanicus TaxID=1457 RepID=A0ABT9XDW4_9BACL|nr:Mov34/MPN/PAD-1 family protein [Alicyclobacillus cycloheptanicus]MDQ0188330.1 proteasome lid subunit RPN8/RPN11 [Alicyclobacillus cycloheptanicus]WDM01044.1 Mov34/MPN/PAD-1 family protein [Alicyclobacillus cycloheptanicus]
MSNRRRARPWPAPAWWCSALAQAARDAAERAYPNECCGLVYTSPSAGECPRLHVLRGHMTPTRCDADARDVIDFAYALAAQGGQVVATFHSHPTGQAGFSLRDEQLDAWAGVHLVLVWRADGWQEQWYATRLCAT